MKKMARKNTFINIRKMLRFLNVAKTWSLHKGCCKAICSKMAYFGVEEPKKIHEKQLQKHVRVALCKRMDRKKPLNIRNMTRI